LQALFAEVEVTPARPADAFGTVFLGGGTPNTYGANDIDALLSRLRERLPGPPDRETTIEVNPELLRQHDLDAYKAAGVTRLSIGVQSFVPSEIRTLGRKHTLEQIEQAVWAARTAGIRSVSIDLIFAVPGQNEQSWLYSLKRAIDLGVDHISTYGLTIEAGTPYESWQAREPHAFFDDAREAEVYDIAIQTLEDAGFEQYEISNFARPGHQSLHNVNYWANGEYVGLGVGAASYVAGVRSVHTRDLDAYITAAVERRSIPGESEQLHGAKRAGEAVMLALRTAQGVPLQGFKERYGVDFLTFYAPVVRRYRDDGLLEVDGAHARLTRQGRFVANDVCAAFVTFE
jgi:oxygen-independent coproporphyrinogen-3 oxidase